MVNVQKPRARGEPGMFTRDPVPGVRRAEPGTAGCGEAVSTAGTEPPQQTHSRNESGPANCSFWEKQVEPLVSRQVRRGNRSETAMEAGTQSSEGRAASAFRVIANKSPPPGGAPVRTEKLLSDVRAGTDSSGPGAAVKAKDAPQGTCLSFPICRGSSRRGPVWLSYL